MAFKFSKSDIKERDEHLETTRQKENSLNEAIEKYNETVEDAYREVEEALSDYNGALNDAREFVDRVRTEFSDEFDEKSEKWQEGDKASAAREWIDSFDTVDLEDVEFEEPELLDEVHCEGLDALENLDTEAAS